MQEKLTIENKRNKKFDHKDKGCEKVHLIFLCLYSSSCALLSSLIMQILLISCVAFF